MPFRYYRPKRLRVAKGGFALAKIFDRKIEEQGRVLAHKEFRLFPEKISPVFSSQDTKPLSGSKKFRKPDEESAKF